MTELAWITGSSSGIGEELARQAAPEVRVIGISRRAPSFGEHLAADLTDPSSWEEVGRSFDAELAAARPDRALLLHFAGTMEPIGPVAGVDLGAYRDSILLNAAAGQVLGAAFLQACATAAVPATLVLCSSPAASAPRAGASQYCAGKAALEMWARAVAAEYEGTPNAPRVFAVVPHRVDTAMVRGAMEASADDLPLGAYFRDSAAAGELATPERVAEEIWATLARDADTVDEVVAVGAVRG